MQTKLRTVIYYYGSDTAKAAQERVAELRAAGGNARIIDAANFADVEDADELEYIEGVPDDVKSKIEEAYAGTPRAQLLASSMDSSGIEIPANWSELSFPELQKLAASLSDGVVRSKEAAMEIIAAEMERREGDSRPELDGMTKAELMDYAEENKIDLDGASKKSDILAAIRSHKE